MCVCLCTRVWARVHAILIDRPYTIAGADEAACIRKAIVLAPGAGRCGHLRRKDGCEMEKKYSWRPWGWTEPQSVRSYYSDFSGVISLDRS